MAARSSSRFVTTQLLWQVSTLCVLAVFDILSLALFTILSVMEFLALVILTSPRLVVPRWRKPLGWCVVVSLILFVAISLTQLYQTMQVI